MSKLSFLYNSRLYSFDAIEWITKPGVCGRGGYSCPLRYFDDKKNPRCRTNLIGHTCKHVVKGSEVEKNQYVGVMTQFGRDADIPKSISRENDDVVKNYDKISRKIIEDASSTCLAGKEKEKCIRLACDGKGDLDGFVSIIGLESDWKMDKTGLLVDSGPNNYKRLGVVSSYYNASSFDRYVMYRLVHQKFFEMKEKGEGVSPVPLCETNAWNRIKNDDIQFSPIDYAFKEGRVLFSSKNVENYASGVIYSFFMNKYGGYGNNEANRFDLMYNDLSSLISDEVIVDINNRLWKDSRDEIYEKMVRVEYIYSAREIMEYLRIVSGEEFRPDIYYENSDSGMYYPSMELFRKRNNHIDKNVKKIGLLLRRRHLSRLSNVYERHYSGDFLEDIKRFLDENEKNGANIGSVADFTAYSVANYLVTYFISLFVVLENCHSLYQKSKKRYELVVREVEKWLERYSQTVELLHETLFDEWIEIFDDLYGFGDRVKILEKEL